MKIFYFKIVYLALFVFASVFSSVAFAAGDSVMMYGKTTPILTNGVNNAGNIWFQNDGVNAYLPAAVSQQAHLTPDPSNPGGYLMEGWAWSDNLGWVSFICRSGTNNGAACGAFDYGVTIDATGTFHGYAWNDAMGYINVNSETYNPPALDGSGRPIVHALKMDVKTGAITGYAWSPSLGWLNFNGVYAVIRIANKPNLDCTNDSYVGACGSIGPDPSSLNFDSFFADPPDLFPYPANGVRVADGVDAYTIGLCFHDKNGALISKDDFASGKYQAKVIFKWEDTVKRNQTDTQTAVTVDNQSVLNKISNPFKNSPVGFAGAVTYKPVVAYTLPNGKDLNVDSGYEFGISETSKEDLLLKWTGNVAEFKITSVAPTTDGNLSKISGTSKGFIENEDFSMFAKSPLTKGLEPNELELVSIDWTIKDASPGGAIITGTSPFSGEHGKLKYKPALAIQTLDGGNDKNTLWMYRNVPIGVEVKGVNNKTKTDSPIINTAIDSTFAEFIVENESKFKVEFTKSSLDASKDDEEIDSSSAWNYIKVVKQNVLGSPTFQMEATIPDKTNLPENYTEGAGLYSKISYKVTAKDIFYFSNHLPRTISTAVSNPAVVIQGTTYAQGNEVFSPQAGINITGIGDQNVNIVRDLVFENIQKLLMGQDIPGSAGAVTIQSLNPSCTAALNGCLKIELDKERIFYFNASNVILNSGGADIEPIDKNTVIIVDGGDIHIESNLYTTNAEKKKLRTGIVALRKNDLGEGNIYIGPDVTNIQALMIADGTMFSAVNYSFTTNDFGEPVLDVGYPTTFNRQLIIEGGVSSRNCIGCVDSAKNSYFIPTRGPLTKDGETDNVLNKEIAKKYDLNYLRYFSLQLKYDDEMNPVDQQCGKALTPEEIQAIKNKKTVVGSDGKCNGIDPIQSKDKGGDLIVSDPNLKAEGAGDKTNPVYIKYVPPSSDSFVFSKEKSLTF